jgi:methylase of polypeptide subunit release factors
MKNNPDFNCIGLDINPRAINLSKINMKLNKIKSENVLLKLIDIKDFSLSNEEDKFDFIISNPPYIPEKSKRELAKELR